MIDTSQIEALQRQVKEARDLMQKAARQVVKEGAAEIFTEYGDIVKSFGWTQYTPYFRDGDECVFGINELAITAQEDEDESVYESEGAFSGYGNNPRVSRWGGEHNPESFDQRYEDAREACRAIYSVFNLDNGLAKDVFGDHVRVIFTLEGVEVEEHDHG